MKLIFAGTPEFAAVALKGLLEAGHEVVLVLTQPDRPAGRGMKVQASAVKQLALDHGLLLAQPHSLKLDHSKPELAAQALEAQQHLQAAVEAGAQVMVVAAYGLILPTWVLNLPPRGCLNIHASLLPRWRGAAPIHRAIEAGDTQTGVTLMQMDAGLDTGDMWQLDRCPIEANDTTGSLHDKLANLGAQAMVSLLQKWTTHDPAVLLQQRTPQPEVGISYAHKIEKSEALIDWQQPAELIERRIRAFNPFPGAHAFLNGELLKIWRAEVLVNPQTQSGPVVSCGTGALRLLEVQRAGGKRQDATIWAKALQPIPPEGKVVFDPPPT